MSIFVIIGLGLAAVFSVIYYAGYWWTRGSIAAHRDTARKAFDLLIESSTERRE